MDREKLKMVAGCYFKSIIGAEPDTISFTAEDHDMREFTMDVRFGTKKFTMWMHPGCNLIELCEDKHIGTFADAAALAGMDRNLNDLPPENETREKTIRNIYAMHERVTSGKEYRGLLIGREKLDTRLAGLSIRELEHIERFYRSLLEPENSKRGERRPSSTARHKG